MKKGIYYLLVIFFLSLFIFSSYKIITYIKGNKENKKIQNTMKDKIKVIKPKENEKDKKSIYEIDFNTLKKDNSDTVGYLEVNGTNINYIVVQTKDNEYYLDHNYNKSKNSSGWIFVDYRNLLDETDKNIIIYGHSIRDGSMFGTLKNTFDKKWRENKENQKIVFVTEKNTYYYQVFSTYDIVPESYYIQTNFKNDKEYMEFLNKLKNRSNYNYGIELTEHDKILTLSTCNWSGSKRVVLHAKLIEIEEEKNNES